LSKLRLPSYTKLSRLFGSPERIGGGDSDRSSYERFALPYSFKPRLSVVDAFAAALAAFLRIFFGSLLFAVWGTYTLVCWSTIPSVFWRLSAMLSLFLLFLVLFAALMISIGVLARFVARRS